MVKILSNNQLGVVEYSITDLSELDVILSTNKPSPTSTATLCNDNGLRIFMVKSDGSGWVEL